MKQKTKTRFQYGPAVILFRDDIEEIFSTLTSICTEVKTSDADCDFESVSELIEIRGTRPRGLEFQGSTPHVTLKLKTRNMYGVELYGDGTPTGDTAFFRIHDILNRRRRLIANNLNPFILLSVAFISLLAYAVLIALGLIWYAAIASCVSAVTSIAGAIGTAARNGFLTKINLSRRHEASTFWSRNSEQLVTGGIGALIGGAIGIGLTKLFDWLAK